jgi:hypothetical protein
MTFVFLIFYLLHLVMRGLWKWNAGRNKILNFAIVHIPGAAEKGCAVNV